MGARMVGMVGIANRPGGYDEAVVESLTPLTQTCANLVGAVGAKREREAAESALKEANEQLNVTVEAFRRQNERMRLLSNLEDLLQTCESRDEASRVVAHMAEQMFAGWSGTLYVLVPQHDVLELVAAWGGGEHPVELSTQDCIAMRRSRHHVSGRTIGPLNCRHVPVEADVGICVPLVGKSESFGLLHLATAADDAATQDLASCESLASTVSRRISVTFSNLRLSESLRDQSVRDPLTQLFNRRYMVETLERELRRAERERESAISVILLDIDHFKTVNDQYRHAVGDLVLTEVADVLRSVTRPSDVACRMGGEEFVIVLPGCDSTVAVKRSEEILTGIRDLVIEHDGDTLRPVTVSAGIATHLHDGGTPDELIRAADFALYEAKAAGRDRFFVA